ncbi:MAG TPA: hypothetical protein VKP58_11585 [Candidatus Acidoferrum sp.]|nr:hypothetical protein [Candidatus Acidoferrum sp.]
MQMWEQLKQPGYVRSMVAILGGTTLEVASYILVHSFQFNPSVMGRGQRPASSALAFIVLWRIRNVFILAFKLPWVAVIFLCFAWLAIQGRNKENGWRYAFFAAFIFVSILRQLIQR